MICAIPMIWRSARGTPPARRGRRHRAHGKPFPPQGRVLSLDLLDDDGQNGLIYVIGRDVTADKEAAQACIAKPRSSCARSQKMEAIGQLTGGIAHDFNNLLTVDHRQPRTAEPRADRRRRHGRSAAMQAAMSGATRAATLTQRLLAYAQTPAAAARAVNLNELVSGMARPDPPHAGRDRSITSSRWPRDLPLCFCRHQPARDWRCSTW